jgi:hypothetical protein
LDIRTRGTTYGVGMLRIISELILNTDQDVCACFIEWQRALDHVKLGQINADPKTIRLRLAQKKID